MVGETYIVRTGLAQDPVRQCHLVKPSGSSPSAVITVCQFCYLPRFYNGSRKVIAFLPAQKWFSGIQNILIFFCTLTNKCTIISQIITLLHVSTLSCHPQGTCNQYLAKLHKYFKCSCWQHNLNLRCFT
jgi:hypothetical protein